MRELVNESKQFNRVEFWVASTVFVFVMFFFITEGNENSGTIPFPPYREMFEKSRITFSYSENYFLPQLCRYLFMFPAFLCLTFIITPKILSGQKRFVNILLFVAILFLLGSVFGLTDKYIKAYRYLNTENGNSHFLFRDSLLYTLALLAVFIVYTGIKYFGVYLLTHADSIHSKYQFITWEGIAGFVIWMIGLFLLIIVGVERVFVILWMMLVLCGIIIYLVAFYRLIPLSMHAKHPFTSFAVKNFVLVALSYLPVSAFLALLIQNDSTAFSLGLLNSVFQLFITVPFTWILYKRRLKGKEEISTLQKEIGRSQANIDFLRSQINPHFLFNALNTLYGTAIQENAERTSEGVQKLGDMMRFMLQENMQDKISLAREIDYLNNYIDLQKLRTDPNPDIQIQVDIESGPSIYKIAPMLLIPFVENAFKHGISFRHLSHIKVSLQIKNDNIFFDVRNSKHEFRKNDPEKDKSGIGLENVKQRLLMLYPEKHELILHETPNEFFIHLTLQLS